MAGASGPSDHAFPTDQQISTSHNLEEEVIPEAINLHSTLPTQTAIKHSKFILVHPRSALEKKGKIPFRISAGSSQFIDVYNTYVFIESKIVGPNGRDIPLTIPDPAGGAPVHNPMLNVLPVNGLSHAWFKQVTTRLNNTSIGFGGSMYAHRGDMELRLSYPSTVKKGSLDMCGFGEEPISFDSANVGNLPFDNPVDAHANYDEFMRRYKKMKGGKHMHTLGRIHTEICDQPKFLPPGSTLDFEFERNSSKFLLLSKRDDNYGIEMVSCSILAHIVEMDEEVTEDIQKTSMDGLSMLYPVRRVHMMYYSKGQNVADLSNYNLLLGETDMMPRRIFVSMVRQNAMQGDLGMDPFNCQHFNMSEFCLKVGSHEIPFPSFDCSMEDDDDDSTSHIWPLFSLLQSTNAFITENEMGIDMSNYRSRNAILGFDLTGSQIPAGECFEASNKQNIELVLKLANVHAFVIDIVVYAEYDAEIEIKPGGTVVAHQYA